MTKDRDNKKIMRKFLLFILLCLIFTSPVFASPAKAVREGNKLYHQDRYDGAMEKYNEAKAEAPDSDIVNFDLGTALYKKGRYQEAVEAFTKAMSAGDKKIEEGALYNMANSKYKLGSLMENSDANGAINLYQESLDYYKRALEMDKSDKDAEYNRELVEKKIKALQEKMKNQPQQQQNKGQDKKDKEGKGPEAKSDKDKQGDKQQQKSGNEQTGTTDDKDKKSAAEKGKEAKAHDKAGQKTQEMSPEEARMLLDAYGEEESGDVFNRERRGHSEEVQKDW
ncbi:MAG: tetratricopeptide repeat protein [Nitrospirae bacterium]|nr:tetratricopeptide repeat protein [Nitrospirota bacterium]